MLSSSIKCGHRETCQLCYERGLPLYNNLTDQLFGAPGEWNLSACPKCGLIWLNPYPLPEEMGRMYTNYYTHADISTRFFIRAMDRLKYHVYHSLGYQNRDLIKPGKFIPFFKNYTAFDLLMVNHSWGKKLLDIGAGNGAYLKRMQDLGWSVEGTEFDPKAAEFAKKNYGVKIHIGELLSLALPANTYDVITLNHVIEHVYDPEIFFQECKRILASGGRLVLLTPNSQSLGHALFRQHWRGLEVPRHLTVFSVDNLGILANRAGFSCEKLVSTARISRYLFSTSVHMRQGKQNIGSGGNRGYWLALKSYGFQVAEEVINTFNKKSGEEIFYIGRKL